MSNNKEDNMQMMIDIPKDDYLMIKLVREHGMGSFAMDIILNGTVLEPCEDTISRKAVKEIINDIRDCISIEGYCAIIERLKKLPSVTPSRR